MYINKKPQVIQELKSYIHAYDTISIVGDMNNQLDNRFTKPLQIKDYNFFNVNGNSGIDLICYIEDNEKIVMDNYPLTIWTTLHKK